MPNTVPDKSEKVTTPAITVVAAIIRGADGRICLSKRQAHQHQGDRWEFPGGKVEADEPLDRALARELNEELAMSGVESSPFMTIAHQYDDLHVTLHFRDVCVWQGEPEGQEGQQVAWFHPSELQALAFPAANQPVVTAVGLPPYMAIAPELEMGADRDNACHALCQQITALDAERYGVYLRQWSDSPSLGAILACCREQGVKVWLRADCDDDVTRAQHAFDQGLCFGVHLTGRYLVACDARPVFRHVISAACHSPADLAHAARLQLDMAFVSPVLATLTHPNTAPLDWKEAESRMRGLPLACYALGGMAPNLLEKARSHGAVGVAGIRAFWGND